jgi:phosphoglycerate dehydrogenase-like enzyme
MVRKLLIYHDEAELYKEILSGKLPRLEIRSAARPEEAMDFVGEAEIILSWGIPDELLKRAKHLAWFASVAAGNEHLVKNPNLPETVLFTKTTIYGEMMAEYVFAYLLRSIRDTGKYLKDQQAKIWDQRKPERLRGKTMGILGLGAVGKEIAKRGKQFGIKVLGVKRTPELVEHVDQIYGPSELEEMIPSVDYLVVVLPLTPETDHLIGEQELRMLKDGAILFNIGRGKTIDQEALIKHLKTGRINAVLDVFEDEPLPLESKLWEMENVIMTPHVSGISLPEEICEEFIENYEKWVAGETLTNRVDRVKGY